LGGHLTLHRSRLYRRRRGDDEISLLNKINKATRLFLEEWKHCAADFAALDHSDEQSIKSMGGKVGNKGQKLLASPALSHLPDGSSEIQHRVVNAREDSGTVRAMMHAIRVTLDGGLLRETQALTPSRLPHHRHRAVHISACSARSSAYDSPSPFIAKSGASRSTSIGPRIAAALLATVPVSLSRSVLVCLQLY